ncbi:MAG: ABC transporter ATP-binding protein [Thermomicrobiales bacterium]|nr:ABC transporter ATP-binding protein [Thermomicrobiales bacterium]
MSESTRTIEAAGPPGVTDRLNPIDDPAVGIRLQLEAVTRSYGPVTAVDRLDLSVCQGELVALLGPSGCGKTTTLRLIAGFEAPDAGAITIAGQRVADERSTVPPERRKVGVVFQDYALFPHLNVGENVAFGIRKLPDRAERVADALALVGLTGLESRTPAQLSGGQQQRVALARSLAPRPDLVLLDEPFSNLDPHLRHQVRMEVREILRRAGATAVLVTHDQEEALTLADRVAVMFEGRIAQCDPPEIVYHRPADRTVAGFVGEAQFLPGEAEVTSVRTELGVLALARERQGPVDVLIRPEMIEVSARSVPGGSSGTVRTRQFTGRDQLLGVELPSGQLVIARAGNDRPATPGDAVSLAVRGSVIAFPV